MEYKNILIPVAFDHETDPSDAIDVAERLLGKGGTITLAAVVEDLPSYVAEYVKVSPIQHISVALRDKLVALAKGRDHLSVAILKGNPGVAIPDAAEETNADLIIVHSHRPGVRDYSLGATAARVVRRAHCTVMVLREEAD